MKKFALISLRNDFLSERDESRDSIDTEIYKLVIEIGFIPILLPNEFIILNHFDKIFKEENIGLVLLSGGNDINKFERRIGSNKTLSHHLRACDHVCTAAQLPFGLFPTLNRQTLPSFALPSLEISSSPI